MTTTDEGVAVPASMKPVAVDEMLFDGGSHSSAFLRIFVSEGKQIPTNPRKGVVM